MPTGTPASVASVHFFTYYKTSGLFSVAVGMSPQHGSSRSEGGWSALNLRGGGGASTSRPWVGPPLPTRDAPADNRSPETAAAVGESERFLEAYTPSCVRKSLPHDMRDLVQDAPLPMGIVPWIGAGGDDGDSGAAAIADPDEIADGTALCSASTWI